MRLELHQRIAVRQPETVTIKQMHPEPYSRFRGSTKTILRVLFVMIYLFKAGEYSLFGETSLTTKEPSPDHFTGSPVARALLVTSTA